MNETYDEKDKRSLQAKISPDVDDFIREEAAKLGLINKVGKVDRLGRLVDQLFRELMQYRSEKKK